MSRAYLDSSAFVKLVLADEPQAPALRRYLQGWPDRVSATLLRTEVLRAIQRQRPFALATMAAARSLFAGMGWLELDQRLLDQAGTLLPPELRSLDAVHLAAALALGSDLGVLVTYDLRMAGAAQQYGLPVSSPC